MKIRVTLSLAAVSLVLGSFPAFAHQGQLPPPKSVDRQKLDRKIDAVSKTPFMTPHQGENLKKVLDGGERMKQDEKVTQPDPFVPGSQPGSAPGAPVAPGQAPVGAPGQENPAGAQAEAPKPEPQKPEFRLMGTVCGKGKPDLAVFDKGGDWPTMLKAGDKLDDMTVVVSVGRGKVCLERIVTPAMPAVQAQPGPDGQPGVAAQPARPEKKERYDLYAW